MMEKREDIIRRLAEKLPAEALQKMVTQLWIMMTVCCLLFCPAAGKTD